MNAKRVYYVLLPLLRSPTVPRAEKIKIYKTLIRPVATYGAESWTLNEDVAKQLATSERKGLRTISGGIEVYEN